MTFGQFCMFHDSFHFPGFSVSVGTLHGVGAVEAGMLDRVCVCVDVGVAGGNIDGEVGGQCVLLATVANR